MAVVLCRSEYVTVANGAGYVKCSCGWRSPVVQDADMFSGEYKSAGQLFDEHAMMAHGAAR